MDDRLENKINKLKNYSENPIGVFGARASGKTMFFTILYGLTGFKDDKNQFSVLCKDEETRKYLSNNYMYVSKGELLPRTEITLMRKIVMEFIFNQSDYALKSFDFAGELLKENSMEEKVLADVFLKRQKKIYEFFATCSGILIFIDPSEDDDEIFRRQDEVNKLLGYIKDENGAWSKSIPIALVITKWDKVSQGKNEVVEKKKAIDYIENHKVYKNVYNILQGATDTVDIFPLSAFGESKGEDLPPDDLNQPFNLFAPMVWISQKRDVDWKNKIKEIFKNEKINAADAKAIIDNFKDSVKNPEILKEVDKIYSAYLAKGRNKIIAIIALIIILIAGFGVGYFFYSEKNRESIDFDKVLAVSNKIEQIDKIDNYIIKYGEENLNSKKLIEKLKDVYKEAIDLETDVNQKEILLSKLGDRFDDGETIEFINSRKIALQEEKRQNEIIQRKKADADTEYKLLETIWKDNSPSLKKYEYSKAFATNFPDYRLINLVKENSEKYLKLADRELYDEIITLSENKNRNLNIIYDKIETYLVKADFKEYKTLVITLKENLKEEEYFSFIQLKVEEYNKNINTNKALELSNAINSYLKNSKQKKFQTQANDYKNKLATISKGISADVELYTDISNFRREKCNVDMRVAVTSEINKKSETKIIFKSKEDINGTIKNMNYVGVDRANIILDTKMEIQVYVTTPDKNEYIFGPQAINFDNVNKEVVLKGPNSDQIKVMVKIKNDLFKIQ